MKKSKIGKIAVDHEHLSKLRIATKKMISSKVIGGYKSVFRGSGMEFDSYRDYSQDDDALRIDWKASAKVGKPLVKKFVEERELNVFFLIDVSNSMFIGASKKTKSEYSAELVSALSYAVLEAGDSVGFALFSENVLFKFPCTKDKSLFYVVTRELNTPGHYGGHYNLNNALKFVSQYLKRGTVVIIVSDFIGLKPGWEVHLKRAAVKFELIGLMVRDITDDKMPYEKDRVVLEDPFGNQQLVLRPKNVKERYETYVKKEKKLVESEFAKAGGDFISLSTESSFVKPIMDFFEKRALRYR